MDKQKYDYGNKFPKLQSKHLSDNKKQVILDAAKELFLYYGFKKTTVNEIAQKAKVGKGTIYLYYRTKEEIMFAMAREEFSRIIKKLQNGLKKVNDPVQKLKSFIHIYPEAIYDFINTYHHGLDLLPLIEQCGNSSYDVEMESTLSMLADVLQSGVEQGIFAIEDQRKMIDYLLFMMRAFMPPYYGELTKRGLTNMIERFADMVISSIST